MALAVLAALIVLTESLRHPLPDGEAPPGQLSASSGDPRVEVTCSDPPPRENQQRSTSSLGTGHVQAVTSSQLYDCPQTYDGQMVQYQGEVVGAVLQRTDGAWVFLNDDVYSAELGPLPAHRGFRGGNAGVGVHIPDELWDQIGFVGGPQAGGDILEVVGTFHRVDPATKEIAVIRASAGRLAARGEPFDSEPLSDRRVVAALLAPLALAAVVAERIAARRR